MNTPYPELRVNLDHHIAAFAQWNAGIERARREYELHPFAACEWPGCFNLTHKGRRFCSDPVGHEPVEVSA